MKERKYSLDVLIQYKIIHNQCSHNKIDLSAWELPRNITLYMSASNYFCLVANALGYDTNKYFLEKY